MPERIIQELNGHLPVEFDLGPDDPCTGFWYIRDEGRDAMLLIVRYKGVPMVHLSSALDEVNVVVRKLGAHTISFNLSTDRYTMQCVGNNAQIELTDASGDQPVVRRVEVISGKPF